MIELPKIIEKNGIDMVITDLDGTLFNSSRQVSHRDYQTLELLGRHKIHRVIATGRSYFSAMRVLPPDFPIDYLIYSTGAGILKWDTKETIFRRNMKSSEVAHVARVLMDHEIDFMILDPVPDSHRFCYFRGLQKNPDFDRRIGKYKPFIYSMNIAGESFRPACQFLVILPDGPGKYKDIKDDLASYKVIRTTSPLDFVTTWVEIFPKDVSKGHAAAWLSGFVNCRSHSVIAIGNDYNDLDLLEWAEHSFVVANAPNDLKDKYFVTDSHQKHGFTKAVTRKWLADDQGG
ncbi:HAD-IIB family hydrolase [candidate division KSB1 bacterium]|nr:HAD-IIB family hydrolase [candidate division KSB1 bacterium]